MQPLFQIHVTLQGSKVEFKPSISELTQTVNTASKEAIATTGVIPRLSEALRDTPADCRPSFYTQVRVNPCPNPNLNPNLNPNPNPNPNP